MANPLFSTTSTLCFLKKVFFFIFSVPKRAKSIPFYRSFGSDAWLALHAS